MKKIVVILFLFTTKCVVAQDNKLFTWDAFQLVAKINPNWHWISDVSYRTIGVSSSANQYTFRTAAKRIIDDKWSVAAGTALFRSRTTIDKHNHEFGNEFRLYQDAVFEPKLNNSLVFANRFRVEERFFSETSTKAAYNALRLRYRIAFVQDITHDVKFQLADEYMRQLMKGDFLFQQNRLSFSGIFVTGKTTQLTGGYMWSKLPTTSQHYILLILQKTVSFKNKKNEQK